MTRVEAAEKIVEYLRRDDRTKHLVWESDAWAFEEAITKAIDEIQRDQYDSDSSCAFCGG